MNITELRRFLGKFGVLVAGDTSYEKTLHGLLKDMDTRGTIWFVDNDGFGHAYKSTSIKSFVEKDFEPMPEKHKGRKIEFHDGVVYYTDTKEECNLKK